MLVDVSYNPQIHDWGIMHGVLFFIRRSKSNFNIDPMLCVCVWGGLNAFHRRQIFAIDSVVVKTQKI